MKSDYVDSKTNTATKIISLKNKYKYYRIRSTPYKANCIFNVQILKVTKRPLDGRH